jgi:teichuronic acid exporter
VAVSQQNFGSKLLGKLADIGPLLWSFADVLGSKVLVLATFIALASYLDPDDFGIVAVASTIIGSLIAAMDASIGGALIQRHEADDAFLDTGFTLATAAGLCFATVIAGIGVTAGLIWEATTIFHTFCALAPGIVFHCGTIAQQSVLVRQNRMGVLARARLLSVAVGSSAAIGWAMVDPSYWVLVILQVSGIMTFSATVWLTSGWRPRVRVDRQAAAAIIRFSRYFWVWGGVVTLERNSDLWLIGATLGTSALGLYTTTQRFGAIIYEVTTSPAIRLVLSTYSRLQNDHTALRERVLAVGVVSAAATMPIFAGVGLLSMEIVELLLEPKWQPVGQMLPVFVAAMYFYSVTMYDYQLLTALHRPEKVLKLTTIGLALQVAAIVATVPFGLMGLVTALLLRALALKFLVFREVQRNVAIPAADYLRTFLPATVSTLAMITVVVAIRRWHLAPNGLAAGMASEMACGAAVYLACLWVLFRGSLYQAREKLLGSRYDATAGLVANPQPG